MFGVAFIISIEAVVKHFVFNLMKLENWLSKTCSFRILLLSVVMGLLKADADPAAVSTQPPDPISAPLVSQRLALPVVETGLQMSNYNGAGAISNAPPQDSYEASMSNAINDTQHKLQEPSLNSISRNSLEWLLRQEQGQLTNHEEQVQRHLDFMKSVQVNPKTAWTNMPDPIEEALASDISKYQRELNDPALAPNLRKSYTAMVDNYTQKLADHRTNEQLWVNLHLAQQNRNEAQIIEAKSHLADYLAVQLGEMQGKTYPTGMSLDAVMEKYRIQSGGGKFDRRDIVLAVLTLITLLPLTFVACKMLWRRKI